MFLHFARNRLTWEVSTRKRTRDYGRFDIKEGWFEDKLLDDYRVEISPLGDQI